MEGDEVELLDIETMGIKVEGLSVGQIRRLKAWYQHTSKDLDLENLEENTRNL